jgi:threonine synthase
LAKATRLSINAIAVVSGAFANFSLSLTTLKSFRLAKETRRSTTRPDLLITAVSPQLKLKHQGCNPTGSFKDTGMTVAVTQARKLGARLVVCASTGNTAASLAAYAARADLQCAIIVPGGQVSGAKLAQALDYGAKVLEIDGNFDACMNVIRELAEDESIYLVNSINPFRIEGQKTVAFELAEQLEWRVPDHLVLPGGNLGNSSAFGKGFRELLSSGLIERQPKITVVQAEGAAPFARFMQTRSTSRL